MWAGPDSPRESLQVGTGRPVGQVRVPGQAEVFGLNLSVTGEPLSRNRHAHPNRALGFCFVLFSCRG